MKTWEINVRDPFVLLYEDVYYLYGTRSATCWGPAEGFDCYTSSDLENWQGPVEIFKRSEDFFATQNFWAPECYYRNETFYLVTTFGSENRKKGIYVLASDKPTGPFELISEQALTPLDWTCIDGSLYWDEQNSPYLLFSHSFEDNPDGEMYAVELSKDLSRAIKEPKLLFTAPDAPWARPVPFAREEFGMEGDVYFTDGPCVYRGARGELTMIWSSWSDFGYAVGTARSADGNIYGPWIHDEKKFFPKDGGHGMLFHDKEGKLLYTLHYPNDRFREHPIFEPVTEENGTLKLVNQR